MRDPSMRMMASSALERAATEPCPLSFATAANAITQACIAALQSIRTVISALAQQADLRDPDEFARSCHILMNGAIIQATEREPRAAQRAQTMAHHLIDQHRKAPL